MKKLKFNQKNIKKIRRAVSVLLTALFILSTCVLSAFAANSGTGIEDALKNFVDLIVIVVRIVGFIMGVYGIIEFAKAQTAHDGAGKMNGAMFFVSGLFVFFAKEILAFIGVSI